MTTIVKKTDTQIQQDVLSELRWDTRVNAPEIGVEVKSGIVTLTGVIESWARRIAAQDAAHRVAGVLDVANDIRVRLPGSLERTDADIAKAVRHALEWNVCVPDERITSTVSDGHITLQGSVDYPSQREDVERAVRYLAGVRGVANGIIVTPPSVAPSDVRKAIMDTLDRRTQREVQQLNVSISEGRVTLKGAVHSWVERAAALGAAEATPGVRSVDDQLRIEPWT